MVKKTGTWLAAFAAIGLASSVRAGADHYAEGVATVPNNSGYGKVYVGMTAQDAGEADAPASAEAYQNTAASKKSGNEENKTFDFYYYVQPQPGCTFLGWSDSETSTEGELGSANPLKLSVPTGANGTNTRQVYPIFSAPARLDATFTGADEFAAQDWFNTGNWDVAAIPESPIYRPVLPAGTSVKYDPVNAVRPLVALNFDEVCLGGGAGEGPAELEIASGEMSVKKLVLGASGAARMTLTGGTLSFFGTETFVVGAAGAGADASEFVVDNGKVVGPVADRGLAVGLDGKGVFTMNGGAYEQASPVSMSCADGGEGRLFLRGGTFTVKERNANGWVVNPFQLGEAAAAQLEVGGADAEAVLDLEDGLVLGNGSTVKVLPNGTLSAHYLAAQTGPSTGTVLLNGGTLKHHKDRGVDERKADNFVSGLAGFYLGANGGTIDTDTAEVFIRQPLLADPALAGLSCGAFVKRGRGRLWLPKGSALGGEVRIEEGMLVVDPSDIDLARVTIAPGAVLAFGTQTGTLTVDTGGMDMDCSNIPILGATTLVKAGEGTLSLSAFGAPAVEVNGGAVDYVPGFRYYRVKCDSVVTWCGYDGGWAMAEFEFYCEDEKLQVDPSGISWDTSAQIDGKTHRDFCSPIELFDGDFETYMLDLRLSSEGQLMAANYKNPDAAWFMVDFGKRTLVTSYKWYRSPTTAFYPTVDGDFYAPNDPTQMHIYGSNDGVTWIELADTVFSADGADKAENRSTNASPAVGGEVVDLLDGPSKVGCTTLKAKAGTSLTVRGYDLHAAQAEFAAGSTVTFDGGALVLDRQNPGVLSGTYNSNLRVKSGTTQPLAGTKFGPAVCVQVDGGATLAIDDASAMPIGNLVYDWRLGGGTITKFNPGANGTLSLVGVPEETSVTGPLSYTLPAVENTARLGTWRLVVDGVPNGLHVMYANGKLVITESGCAIFIR